MDEIIQSLEDHYTGDDGTPETGPESSSVDPSHRARLAAVVAGGQSRELLGKAYSPGDIERADPAEIKWLYAVYEARIGSTVSKVLKKTLISLYSRLVARVVPIDNQESLEEDLGQDPFISQMLTAGCCMLYNSYRMFLAPLTTLVITASHIEATSHIEGKPTNEYIRLGKMEQRFQPPNSDFDSGDKGDGVDEVLLMPSAPKPWVKDPKKVAAGRAGVRARRANAEALQRNAEALRAELLSVKAALADQITGRKTVEEPEQPAPPRSCLQMATKHSFGITTWVSPRPSLPLCLYV